VGKQEELAELLAKVATKGCAACGGMEFTITTLDLCPAGYPCSKGDWHTCAVVCNNCGLIRRHDLRFLKKGDVE
jgi:hypothetical protein